jgi:excinuclease ABC subunit C
MPRSKDRRTLFARQAFTGFGPCALAPGDDPPTPVVVEGRLRTRVLRECPPVPGVYGMLDPAGELIYVGKAKSLRGRLLSYFRPGSRDPKAGRILEQTQAIAWEPGTTEFAALLRELELIRRWLPRMNVQGQPQRQKRCYLCLGRGPAPYAFVAGRPPRNTVAHFGPVPAGEQAREAARRVNDLFRLRDCPRTPEIVFAGQQELFPVLYSPGCLRHDIGTCSAPCAARCTSAGYASQIDRALAFLAGEDRSILEPLEREMHAAAEALTFEKAAALRDRLAPLQWLDGHLTALREGRGQSFVYEADGDGETWWYLIHQGRPRAALRRPETAEEYRGAGVLLESLWSRDRGREPTLDEVDAVLLVLSWFRQHPEERLRTLSPAEALAACAAPCRAPPASLR